MKKSKIYFRADGHSKMGLGHVIRSLALAEMLSEQHDCHFLIKNPLPTLKEQILGVCKSCIELIETKNGEEEALFITNNYLTSEDTMVLDGYHFNTTYQKAIKKSNCRLFCIDDIHAYHFIADAIINHAGGIDPNSYSIEPHTKCYFGIQYALLRKPFRQAAQSRSNSLKNRNLFICLGGADPNNDTLAILKRCEATTNFENIYLVLGAAYSYRNELDVFLFKSDLKVEILSNLSATKMVQYMKRCSSAITPPSTISFEYLSVGGILYLQRIADNQKSIEAYFLKEGLAFSMDTFPIKDSLAIQKSLTKQAELLDGKAQDYYLKIFSTTANVKNLSFS